jgi:chromosome segregation ATPase
LECQKDFSQKASSHIAALAAAKANLEKAICDLTSEVMAEREALKLNSETEELPTPMKYNTEPNSDILSSLKENLYQYKEELKCVIQKLKSDIKTQEFDIEQKNLDVCRKKCEIKSATDRIAELMSEIMKKNEKIVEQNKKIEELCSKTEELKAFLQENSISELKLKIAEREAHCQR